MLLYKIVSADLSGKLIVSLDIDLAREALLKVLAYRDYSVFLETVKVVRRTELADYGICFPPYGKVDNLVHPVTVAQGQRHLAHHPGFVFMGVSHYSLKQLVGVGFGEIRHQKESCHNLVLSDKYNKNGRDLLSPFINQ